MGVRSHYGDCVCVIGGGCHLRCVLSGGKTNIEKIKNKYRYLMTVRGTGLKTIREAIRILALHRIPPAGVSVAVDVDAQDLM